MASTTRRFINQLGERENVDQVFAVGDKQLRANRAGNLYLHLRLVDKSGWITGMLWNASEGVANSFEAGDYVNVQGTTQLYNGSLQMIVTRVEKVPRAKVDEADFVTLRQTDIDRLIDQDNVPGDQVLGIRERIDDLMLGFESEHPKLASVLSQLTDLLSGMGI